MLIQVKRYLPLKILKIEWNGTTFHMHGSSWGFSSLSSWRISAEKKIVFGCFDKDSTSLIANFENMEIKEIGFQNESLKIDPVFFLSNGQKIEIFSTDTYEPWIFHLDQLGTYVATPSEPNDFD
ncbi:MULTISPECIES: hypothetical protein [Parachlamydia]|uniref:hypothetical protein n=1 Tax=Parachlamydia TaxID=83551 RepID=UPI00075074E7|nr:hypothetical protein [Parachlamydia acanthamoebae]